MNQTDSINGNYSWKSQNIKCGVKFDILFGFKMYENENNLK